MSSIEIMRVWKEKNPQVENIMLFVSDSLRWDYTPKSVMSQGITFKTISSGTFTAVSFPSIVTGLYPQHHGVHTFRDRLSKDIRNLLNLQGYNSSLWTENTWIGFDPPESSPLHQLLQHKNRVSLEELEPPFIYLENEKGGHCPYGWSFMDMEYEEFDCISFFRDYGKKGEEALRKKYQEGIERSVKEFEKRMQVINKRGLADNTLVIFLSDHGELLGEYGGVIGHQSLTAPEVVYVPTIFIHPDLPKGRNFEKEGVFRHVDLYPTICDLLNRNKSRKTDGVSLFNIKKLPDIGYTFLKHKMKKGEGVKSLINYELKEVSFWDKDGGYLFREGAGLLRLLRVFYVTILCNSSTIAIYQRERLKRTPFPETLKNFYKLLKYFYSPTIKYKYPSFSPEEIRFSFD